MEFKVNNLTWQMEYVDEDRVLMNSNDGVYFGFCEYIPQKISIRTGMSAELTRETVIHELGHCFLFSYGVKGANSYSEEQVCDFIGAHADSIVKLADKFMVEVKKC